MNRNKIVGLIVVILGVILILVGVIILNKPILSSAEKTTKDPEIKNQQSFNNIEYSNYSFITKEEKTYFKFTLKNLKEAPTNEQQVRITFYSSDNKRISTLDTTLPALQPSTTIDLEIEYTGAKIVEEYTIKIEKVGTAIEVG